MKMNRDSSLYKALRRLMIRPLANPEFSRRYGSASGQSDYSPVDPEKDTLPKMDNSPQAVEERTKAARNSLLVPLAVIAGVIVIFAIAILLRTH